MDILDLLKQRRVWAGIVGVMGFVITAFNLPNFLPDQMELTELLTAFGSSLSSCITAGLALWSYFKPKR